MTPLWANLCSILPDATDFLVEFVFGPRYQRLQRQTPEFSSRPLILASRLPGDILVMQVILLLTTFDQVVPILARVIF